MSTMKAMQYQRYGGPEQLRLGDVPRPIPSPDQVLVKLTASSVNPVDWKLHNGSFRFVMPVKMPSIPGFDLAGEVIEVGSAVTGFTPGERIYAMLDSRPGGASAEYAVVGTKAAALMPANLSEQEAAAIPLAGLTALQALRDGGRLVSGQRILVVGASGGVGHYAVQIAKAMGAHVTAVCSARNIEMVRGLGADHVIDYTSQSDFVTDGPYDVIFDTIATSPFKAFVAVMTRQAVYVCTLPNPALIARAFLMPLYSKRRVRLVMVKSKGEDLRYLTGLVEEGKLRPVIDRTLPLEQLPIAHALSQEGRTAGKIVIGIGQ